MNQAKQSIYELEIKNLGGDPIDLNLYKGKKILFINVASECGFTSQYNELQHLHETHGKKVSLIGVPCNQFGGQEPGSASQIANFCQKNFGVSFLMTEKIDVKGTNQHPIYQWLTQKNKNGKADSTVEWNFQKYLLDENGNLLAEFAPGVNPLDESILNKL